MTNDNDPTIPENAEKVFQLSRNQFGGFYADDGIYVIRHTDWVMLSILIHLNLNP